jgi:hypothetical protein
LHAITLDREFAATLRKWLRFPARLLSRFAF